MKGIVGTPGWLPLFEIVYTGLVLKEIHQELVYNRDVIAQSV
jgi:hypothetical protein